jgi:hypothetical protein
MTMTYALRASVIPSGNKNENHSTSTSSPILTYIGRL